MSGEAIALSAARSRASSQCLDLVQTFPSRGAKSRAALSVQSKASRPATPSLADGLTRTVAGEPRSHQRAQCIELRARWPMGALGFCHDDVTDCLLIGQRFDVPASKLDASSSATSMGWWLWSTDPPSSLALPEVTPRSVLQRTHGARQTGLQAIVIRCADRFPSADWLTVMVTVSACRDLASNRPH